MRKILIIGFVALLSVALMYAFADAKVSGACVNCHTMHNSQNNAPMVFNNTFNDPIATPKGTLLRGTCLGCHGQGTGDNIITGIPQVLHTNATDLAGGNFAYITGGKAVDPADSVAVANKYTVGHNVRDLGAGNYEGTLSKPPGDEFTGTNTVDATSNFTCAGINGCHGDRTVTTGSYVAIKYAHHKVDTVLKFGAGFSEAGQGGSPGLSYRFLYGVKGGEETNWMGSSPGPTVHNEYKGASDGLEATYSTPGSNTISGLCAECHGNFHGPKAVGSDITNTATGSPWLRHPTDIVISGTGEYAQYNTPNTGDSRYSINAPLARQTIPTTAPSGLITLDTDVVMCLSCHKAHASANADILRWNYSTINAGGSSDTTRCFICHTTKDTGG